MIFLSLTLFITKIESLSTIPYTKTDNFLHCRNVVKGNCQLCDEKYFLFSLPQDSQDLGLKAGTRICVQCPFSEMNDENNFYCGDCLDQSQTWDNTRICTYDYKTKSSTDQSVYHKIERPELQLYYVVQSGLEDFATTLCDGCLRFCASKSSTCFPVSTAYQYDTNKLYIQCAAGYAYSEVYGGCESCPQNCLSCIINIIRKTDSGGLVTLYTEKKCLICQNGFSLLTTRTEVDSSDQYSQCIACFAGCNLCYFGKNDVNLNQDSWDDYNNDEDLLTSDYEYSETEFYRSLFIKFGIAQRCYSCASTSQSKFIPSLNKKTCIRCGISCSRCEYVSYSPTTYPSRSDFLIIEPENPTASQSVISQLESQYLLRCRECDDYAKTFLAIGTGCTECTIFNCHLCHKTGDPSKGGDTSFSTLQPDFIPFDKEEYSMEQCLQCIDGYFLSEDGTCVEFDSLNLPPTGCLTFERAALVLQCKKCDTGYTLKKNLETDVWECYFSCEEGLQDYLCQSCVYNNGFRCQKCLDGFYVDMKTGKCKQCMPNGNCKTCYTMSLTTIHRFDYYEYAYDNDPNIFGPYCIGCISGDANKGPFLNVDQRTCEKGGESCLQFQAKGDSGYCDICDSVKVDLSRSSSIDHSDCIPCPPNTVGCRKRTQDEINFLNQFFDPQDESYRPFSNIAYKCTDDEPSYYLNNANGRCIKMADCGASPCDKQDQIELEANCQQNVGSSTTQWNINEQFKDFTSKNSTIILENILSVEDRNKLYYSWNNEAVNKVSITLKFNYQPGDDAKCFFQKDTYITTNIRRNVFSIKELELMIVVSGNDNKQISWYIQNNIYFEYFTLVSLKDIQILPATNLDLYSNVEKLENPFGIQLTKNDGSKFYLENVQIGNTEAENFYKDKTQYTNPYSSQASLLKNFRPFYTTLLNTFDIQLIDVVVQSQNYILSPDSTFQPKLFGLTYDNDVSFQYFNIRLNNVQFYDISVENQALFELQDINMITAPEWNSKIFINQVQFKDAYFINDGGFLSTKVTNKPLGIIVIDNLFMERIEYNNSRGIANFNTLQSLKIYNFNMIDSYINYTSLFLITTIDISQISIKNTKFTMKGHFISTQFQLKTVRLNDPIYSGLMIRFINMEFNQIICLTPGCLIYITEISNNYELQLNITMNNIIIEKIISIGFDDTTWNAATSAAIIIEKCYKLNVISFQSIQNPDLTLFYTNQLWIIQFIGLICKQDQNLNIRNNYCIFINNFYQQIQLINTQLLNLNGIDNSFIGISSWSNLVYNTSTNLYNEQIYIDGLYVSKCTITTTAVALPSSSILIDSTQMQFVQATNMQFYDNSHFQKIAGSLKPSNPTFIIMSVVGTLKITESIFKSNSVSGHGATFHVEVGTSLFENLRMENSNFDSSTKTSIPDINQVTRGGHLYVASYDLYMYNCSFYNSTAQLGGGIYFKMLKEGNANIDSIIIQYAYTPLDNNVVSRGGCMYIDSTASKLQMTLNNIELKDCFARGEGGGIYLDSFDQQQMLILQNSIISNTYSLSGMAMKIVFNERSEEEQKVLIQSNSFVYNYSNTKDFITTLTTEAPITEIEQYLFIKRYSVLEQDYGQIEIFNTHSVGIFYASFISLLYPQKVWLHEIQSENGKNSYRANIEIIEPQINPVVLNSIQFRNISSLESYGVDCTLSDPLCTILSIRMKFPDYHINPAMLFIDQILKSTPLYMKNILIDKVICNECHGGLVQIMRVSNTILQQLVEMDSCRCSNSFAPYYGCFAISSEKYFRQLSVADSQIGINYSTNLSYEAISLNTGLSETRRLLSEDQNLTSNSTNLDLHYTIPNPPYLAHILISSLSTYNMTSTHGGGVSIYGLTANVTRMYCTQSSVYGQGACIYYESYPKVNGDVYQRLMISQCILFKNNALIGGAIRVVESGINDWSKTENTIIQNKAKLFGDNVAQYPTHIGLKTNNELQKEISSGSNRISIMNPLVTQSGQQFNQYKNQSILIVLLDQNNSTMGYQFQSICNLTSQNQSAIQGSTMRMFDIEKGGCDYSNQVMIIDPYEKIEYKIEVTNNLINIPVYSEKYPYQLIGFLTDYTLYANVQSIECLRGEEYNQQQHICISCQEGQYSIEYMSACHLLNELTMNYTIRDRISIKEGYWRPREVTDDIELCGNKKINCQGGFDVGNDICIEGTIGALCEECDIYGIYWPGQYTNSKKYVCEACPNMRAQNIFWFVFFAVFTVNTFLLSMIGNQQSVCFATLCIKSQKHRIWKSFITVIGNLLTRTQRYEQIQKLNQLENSINLLLQNKILTIRSFSIVMKIFFNHSQLLTLIAAFNIPFEQTILNILYAISMPVTLIRNTLSCILIYTSNNEIIYLSIIWAIVILTLSFLLIIVIFEFIDILKENYIRSLEQLKKKLMTLTLFMFIYCQPDFVQSLMLLLKRRTISEDNYVQANVSYLYDSNQHQNWIKCLCIPGLIAILLIFPLLILLKLIDGNKRKKTIESNFLQRWGVWYAEYKKKSFLWEFVRFYFRSLIFILAIQFSEDILEKGLIFSVILLVYLVFFTTISPYIVPRRNFLELVSIFILIITYGLGIFTNQRVKVGQNYVWTNYTMYFLNGLFYIYLLFHLFEKQIEEFILWYGKKSTDGRGYCQNYLCQSLFKIDKYKKKILAQQTWKKVKNIVLISNLKYKEKLNEYRQKRSGDPPKYELQRWNTVPRNIQIEDEIDFE